MKHPTQLIRMFCNQVVPYYGYARADRKSQGRESIAAKLTANIITEAGASRVLAMDLHSGQCVGYFDIPVGFRPLLLCVQSSNQVISVTETACVGANLTVSILQVDHVYGDSVILDYLASKRIATGDLVVVSPDVGGVARAR